MISRFEGMDVTTKVGTDVTKVSVPYKNKDVNIWYGDRNKDVLILKTSFGVRILWFKGKDIEIQVDKKYKALVRLQSHIDH